jgi:hypothetical protein
MYELFDNKLVTPTMLKNVLEGFRQMVQIDFIGKHNLSDKSSCGVWSGHGSCHCGPEPGEACRLKDICVTMRAELLAAAHTLAGARREESAWLLKNIERLLMAEGKPLLELMGRHPGHVGDLIIFWEVPDGWKVLTRDRTFRILKEAHREEIEVHILRLPRMEGSGKCQVRFQNAEEEFEGVLVNYTAKGARVRLPSVVVRRRDLVTITAPELGSSRVGEVIHLVKADQSFGVKFKRG